MKSSNVCPSPFLESRFERKALAVSRLSLHRASNTTVKDCGSILFWVVKFFKTLNAEDMIVVAVIEQIAVLTPVVGAFHSFSEI